MKRSLLIFLLMVLSSSMIFAGDFPTYDLTFYKTIQDSIAIINGERFGFDYSGYGYLGQNVTSGIYLRIGIQTPYQTILDFFTRAPELPSAVIEAGDGDEENQLKGLLPETESDNSIDLDEAIPDVEKEEQKLSLMHKDYKLSFTLGPAFRRFISEEAIWYMGMGFTSIVENETSMTNTKKTLLNDFKMKLGADLDTGFRVDLEKRTTMRVGFNARVYLASYESTSKYSEDGTRLDFENSLSADIFSDIGEDFPLSAVGYISLATTFKPQEIVRYKYVITENELGSGILTEIQQKR